MAIRIESDGHVGRVLRSYSGRQVEAVEVAPDPQVQGVFAIKAWFAGGPEGQHRARTQVVQAFLVRVPLHKLTEEDLEEVDFATWPPAVRS